MIPDRIVYTDGHDVTVTDSALHIGNTAYKLDGIIRYGLIVIRPQRLAGIALILLGLVVAAAGFFRLLPADMYVDHNMLLDLNLIAQVLGVVLLMGGVVAAILSREKYALRIATAEGEKNAVVSRRKEYINQIVDALHASARTTGAAGTTIPLR